MDAALGPGARSICRAWFTLRFAALSRRSHRPAGLCYPDRPAARLVRAARGLGKTTVLRQAIGQVRGPRCRIVVVSEPLDGATLLGRLAAGLGAQPGPEPSLDQAWRSLERAVRVHSLEGFQVVLAIDDCRGPAGGCAGNLAAGLVGLGRLAPGDRRGVTVVQLQQDDPDEPATDAEALGASSGAQTADAIRSRGLPPPEAGGGRLPRAHLHRPRDHAASKSLRRRSAGPRAAGNAQSDGRGHSWDRSCFAGDRRWRCARMAHWERGIPYFVGQAFQPHL